MHPHTDSNSDSNKFQTSSDRHLVQSRQTPHCWALQRWTEWGIQRKTELWGMKKFNSDNSDSWANLKGSSEIKFRLCYLNIYLKDILEIWVLLWIWFSAFQKQAKLEFSRIELSFTKIFFLAFQVFSRLYYETEQYWKPCSAWLWKPSYTIAQYPTPSMKIVLDN